MSDLFGGAAPYYARYRASHGEEAIAHLAREAGADARVLDLGCGPGTVAIPLAARVREVIAADPDPEMLDTGRRLAEGAANIRWLRGDSTTLRELPAFDHVVMGRSFHWMDRRAVLAELDALLPPGGAVMLVGPSREDPEEPWEPVVRPVRREFGLGPMTAGDSFQATGEHHDDVLKRSPFSRMEETLFAWTATRDVDAVTGLQLSYSYSSPALLGARAAEFTAAVREALLAARPSGVWEQRIVTSVLVARRP
ncbi:class I SAM-dependent methyltransferase [Nonomuraea sp. SBT364]|uniref:class I SAM-dependent methyltransferase n=1 Tax=Nonomuraea sp. SBT364 TaxID=1580530 RepID=UPI00066DD480|nr:class I SAM-dependent methyltransferase [Nonomuraea sp. SBT364]